MDESFAKGIRDEVRFENLFQGMFDVSSVSASTRSALETVFEKIKENNECIKSFIESVNKFVIVAKVGHHKNSDEKNYHAPTPLNAECCREFSEVLSKCLERIFSCSSLRGAVKGLCYIIFSLGEKGEPLSSLIFNCCAEKLLIYALSPLSGKHEQDILLGVVSSLCLQSDSSSITHSFKSFTQVLDRLAMSVFTLSFEAQMSVFFILSKSINSKEEAYRKASIWFQKWPSLKCLFTEYSSVELHERSGQFINEIFKLSRLPSNNMSYQQPIGEEYPEHNSTSRSRKDINCQRTSPGYHFFKSHLRQDTTEDYQEKVLSPEFADISIRENNTQAEDGARMLSSKKFNHLPGRALKKEFKSYMSAKTVPGISPIEKSHLERNRSESKKSEHSELGNESQKNPSPQVSGKKKFLSSKSHNCSSSQLSKRDKVFLARLSTANLKGRGKGGGIMYLDKKGVWQCNIKEYSEISDVPRWPSFKRGMNTSNSKISAKTSDRSYRFQGHHEGTNKWEEKLKIFEDQMEASRSFSR